MFTPLRVVVARVIGFLRPQSADREFELELEAHLRMAEADKVKSGLSPEEARRRARIELGGVTQLREAARETRGLPLIDTYWLDLKLAVRMLRRSWGLTLVGGFAMMVVIGIAAIIFTFVDGVFWPTLPLFEGDRVVAIQVWDEKGGRRHNASMYDVERWRDSLHTVEDVGAFHHIERNLIPVGGVALPVVVAEMTASGFGLARVAPLLGRPLLAEDEVAAAIPAVVIGHAAWQAQFAADPEIVGKTVRLSDTIHTIVGVMPESFAFPVNYSYWTALRLAPSAELRTEAGEGVVFARLRAGETIESLGAELAALGLLTLEEADQQLRPRAIPHAFAFTGDIGSAQARWVMRIVLFLFALLMVPPCANIAILIYARSVTRQEEFAARFALGASRRRIVAQLFIEALVLATGAAMMALLLVRLGLLRMQEAVMPDPGAVPFWIDLTVSYRTVLFALGLAVLAAVIAGIVPALKATGARMQSGLRSLGSGNGAQLGATWTLLVVTQVALSVAALPVAVEMGWGTLRQGVLGPGIPAEEYVTARLSNPEQHVGEDPVPGGRGLASPRRAQYERQLVRRFQAEPGVSGVSVAAAMPGTGHWLHVVVDEVETEPTGIFNGKDLVRTNRVDARFFEVFDASLLMGRRFAPGDFGSERSAIVVNQNLARDLLGGENPLGRRLRYRQSSVVAGQDDPVAQEQWFEIVGVVSNILEHHSYGAVYHPLAPGESQNSQLALRLARPSEGSSVASREVVIRGAVKRLREISTALDPSVVVEEIRTLDAIYSEQAVGNNNGAFALAAVTLSVLLLSAAGMYALMSFTVNQRRREIGIRSALGGQPHRLLLGIFRRSAAQLAGGGALGIVGALFFERYLPIEGAGGSNIVGIVPMTAVLMMTIGLLAALGPARRGLRVDPSEELREG